MLKTLFLSISLLCCSLIALSQPTNAAALLGNPGSLHKTITKARTLIWERFYSKDTATVRLLFNYANKQVENTKYEAFYPDEYSLLSYWLGDFHAVINRTSHMDSAYVKQLKKKKLPSSNMQAELVEVLRQERDVVYNRIYITKSLKEVDKTFLKLNFDYLLSWGAGKDPAMDSLNVRVARFQNRNSDSPYQTYVRSFVGVQFKTRPLGFSVEFFTGLGFFDGKAQKALGIHVPVGIAVEAHYHRFVLQLREYVGYGQTQDTIHTSATTWARNSPERIITTAATLGYQVIDGQNFKLRPFVGLSGASAGPPFLKANSATKDAGFDLTSTMVYGISMDFFVGLEKEKKFNWANRDRHYLRLAYAYSPAKFDKHYSGYSGSLHTVTLGFVLYNQPHVRIK